MTVFQVEEGGSSAVFYKSPPKNTTAKPKTKNAPPPTLTSVSIETKLEFLHGELQEMMERRVVKGGGWAGPASEPGESGGWLPPDKPFNHRCLHGCHILFGQVSGSK